MEPGIGVWVPYEKNSHFCRRRRWVRTRVRAMDAETMEKKAVGPRLLLIDALTPFSNETEFINIHIILLRVYEVSSQ